MFWCNMEIRLLNGTTARVKLRGKKLRSEAKSKSKFQHRIGQQLVAEYPHDVIYEEVHIPFHNFVIDFFIPSVGIVVECHGRQHVEHVKHFHKTRKEFHNQQDVDQLKRDWCEANGFRLIEIYDE